MAKISLTEAAKRLNVHRNTIENWIKSGHIQATRTPTDRSPWLIEESEIQRIGPRPKPSRRSQWSGPTETS